MVVNSPLTLRFTDSFADSGIHAFKKPFVYADFDNSTTDGHGLCTTL
jgi:hypothetical protein